MTGARRARAVRRGFTLLEVLVALAILGLGIASVLQLMGNSARAATRTRVTTEALFVAEELMEELATLNEPELRSRARETGDYAEHEQRMARLRGDAAQAVEAAPAHEGLPLTYAITITPDRNEPALYVVRVQVRWPGARGEGVELTTLRRFATAEESRQ